MIEPELVDILQGFTDNVYPSVLQEKTNYPAVVYQQTGGPRVRSHSGTALKHPLYQVSVYGVTFASAKELARDISDYLDCYKGTDLLVVFVENEFDDYFSDSVPPLYRRILSIRIWCREEAYSS